MLCDECVNVCAGGCARLLRHGNNSGSQELCRTSLQDDQTAMLRSSSGQVRGTKIGSLRESPPVGSRRGHPTMTHGRARKVAVSACYALRRRALLGALAIPCGCAVGAVSASPRKQIQLSVASDVDLLAFKPDRLTCPTGAPCISRFLTRHTRLEPFLLLGLNGR
jgi:hypothetical protein